MQSLHCLALSLACLTLYLAVASADCPATSRGKIDVCVASFSTANLLNQSDRKNRIDNGNTNCPVDILNSSCTSFDAMIGCVNILGFPSGCEQEFNTELTNQDFRCTYLELGVLCPDADTISAATSVVVSLFLVGASLLAAICNRL